MKKQVKFTKEYGNNPMKDIFIEANEVGKEPSLTSMTEILGEINGGAVCIAANSCSDVIANELCGTFNHREVRQYLLLSDKKSSKRILGKKYVRIMKTPQNGMVLIHVLNKKVRTWVFSDPSSTSGHTVAGEDIYRTFCNLFWSKKIECEFRGDDVERVPDSPLSQDMSVDDRCSMPGQIEEVIGRFDRDLFLQDVKSDVPSDGFSELHVSEMSGCERICKASEGNAVLFTKGTACGFSLVGDGKTGYLLPGHIDNDAVNWSVPLKSKEYGMMTKAFDTSWKFIRDITLKDAVGKKIRYADAFDTVIDIKKTETVKKEYRCDTVEEYLDETKIEKGFMNKMAGIRSSSCRKEFNVTAMPPNLPSGSKKDSLHDEWGKVSKEWASELDGLRADCKKYCEMVSELGGKIAVSFNNRREDLEAEIDALLKSDISKMSKPRRDQILDSYSAICQRCETFRIDCDSKIQEQKFQSDKKKSIQKLENEITELKDKIKNKEGELKELESRSKEKEKEKAREKALKKAKEEKERFQSSLANKESELGREQKKVFKYEENALHSTNRIVAKTFKFPSEELPVFESAMLHTADGKRYISIPDSSEESCLTDDNLLRDSLRLKAMLVVRE